MSESPVPVNVLNMNKSESWQFWWKVILRLSTDSVDACIHSDISVDAVDYEAESWSLTVEHKFCKKQDKRAVKRQDVIYGKQIRVVKEHHWNVWFSASVYSKCIIEYNYINKITVTTYNCQKLLWLINI